jgi:DNA-binding winged helix-turn-helix (wHTH) protein
MLLFIVKECAMSVLVLDCDGRRLFENGNLLMRLNIHEASILLLLIENKVPTSRKDLLAAGWPHTIVSENSVNMAVKSIRSLTGFKDIITTEQGIGYCFNHENYRIDVSSNSSQDNAYIPHLSDQSVVSSTQEFKNVKSRTFSRIDVVNIVFSTAFGLFFYFSSENVYCQKFDKIEICSIETQSFKLARTLILMQNETKNTEEKVYYYGLLNGYKEHVVVEIN